MIRKAKNTIKEVQAIYQLITDVAAQNSILPRSINEIKGAIGSFYIAVVGNKIVGCCSIEIYSSKLAEIRSLVVLPEYQNKSFGGKLVDVCVAEAAKKGVYEVVTITNKDVFFEKAGFSKCLNGQWAMFIKLK